MKDKQKDRIIIVEGPQGAGKTTFTNYLREKMTSTDLYRLQGIKDKTSAGLEKSKKRYETLLEYMKNTENVDMLFDRTFFSEEVYCRLGYKDYSFTEVYNDLLEKLNNLDSEIYLVILYLDDKTEYENRLNRDKHAYQEFKAKNSILQQEAYLKLADEVEERAKNIKVIRFENTSEHGREERVEQLFRRYKYI